MVEEDYIGYAAEIMEGLKLWVSVLNNLIKKGITQAVLDTDKEFKAQRMEYEVRWAISPSRIPLAHIHTQTYTSVS